MSGRKIKFIVTLRYFCVFQASYCCLLHISLGESSHLNKQARPELPVLQGDTPALLLGAVCICQGCWPPAICAAPLLTHSCLPPWEMCHPGHRRAQSWQLLETEAAHLTPAHTTTVCTKEELAQCLHVTRSSVHFHHL